MIQLLLEPFGYAYMRDAMWVSALVGGVCAFLSAYLMLKGWSLIGDALSHAIVPGVAGAYMLGFPFSIGAFFSGALAAGAMLFLNQRTKLREDAIIGLIFTSFFGLGLFMVSLSPTSVNIQTIVLGNILAISPSDTLQLAIIGFVAIGALTSLFGAYISYFLDGATGGVIVVLQTAIFGLAFVFAPKHGILAARRKAAAALRDGDLLGEEAP